MKLTRSEFEALALAELDRVDRLALMLTRRRAEADDLVQETYLRAIKAWESFDLQAFGIRPWLLRITHNIYVTRSAREAKQPRLTKDEVLDAAPAPQASDQSTWHGNEALDQAMGQLPAELRSALLLWAIDELTYQEIADVMGIPIGTVMSRLHRARSRLRQLMESPKVRLEE